MESKAPVHYYILLWLVVWLIYLTDRLIDATKLKKHATSIRHKMYYKWQKPLASIALTVLLVVSGYTYYLWQYSEYLRLLRFGNGMFWLTVVYLLYTQYSKGYLKEVFVTAIFWMGIALYHLPPISMFSLDQLITVGCFGLIIFINLQLVAIIEAPNDKLQGHGSLVQWLGLPWVQKSIYVCFVVLLVALLILARLSAWEPLFTLSAMYLVLLLLMVYHAKLTPEIARLFSDLIFIFPIVPIIFGS